MLPETFPLAKMHVSWPTNLGNISARPASIAPYFGVFWVAAPEANELGLMLPTIFTKIGVSMWVFGA